jgi:cytochrome P450
MTMQTATWPRTVEDIDLSSLEFWARPLDERERAFALLRKEDPVPFYAEPEAMAPFIPLGRGYFALTRHADVLEASRRPEDFRSSPTATSIPDMPPEFTEFFGSMINMDDPRHARLRRIVSRAFTPRMLARLEDQVQEIARSIVEEMADRRSCDFVVDIAAKLPLKVICDMMGVPQSDYQMVLDRSNLILAGGDTEYLPDDPSEAAGALLGAGMDLSNLVQELARFRRESPTDDLTSALVTANVDGETLTDQELGSFFILLVVAGNETTRTAMSHGLRLLTEHPDQKELWFSDFERYAPTAVEEIVRVASPVMWMRRTATRDTELRGRRFAEGDKLLLFYWSANRDEEVFADPYRFDVTRSPNPHVGFGGPGPHFCLGAHLARREITVMFRELARRMPSIRASGPPAQLLSSFINGVKHLPAEW